MDYRIVVDAGHGESVKSKNSEMTILVSKYKSLRYFDRKVSFIYFIILAFCYKIVNKSGYLKDFILNNINILKNNEFMWCEELG